MFFPALFIVRNFYPGGGRRAKIIKERIQFYVTNSPLFFSGESVNLVFLKSAQTHKSTKIYWLSHAFKKSFPSCLFVKPLLPSRSFLEGGRPQKGNRKNCGGDQ